MKMSSIARKIVRQRSKAERAEEKRCDLCRGYEFQQISSRDRHGDSLRTSVCTTCGLVCHTHVPTEQELEEYYRLRYRQDYHCESQPSARRVMRAWQNGKRIFQQLHQNLRPGNTVLEIGAGLGCTVKQFELAGYSARGVEPGATFQRFSRDVLCAQVEPLRIEDLAADIHADLILLVHVIEHLRSPRESLRRIRSHLPPRGFLYVECPNLAEPFARPSRLFHKAHIHNFTPDTLTMLAGRCGFEVVQRIDRPGDKNLRILLRRAEMANWEIDPTSYIKTMHALHKYTDTTYHLRWQYARERGRFLWRRSREAFIADRYVEQVMQQCQSHTRPTEVQPTLAE